MGLLCECTAGQDVRLYGQAVVAYAVLHRAIPRVHGAGCKQ